jgi:hypothetical protein
MNVLKESYFRQFEFNCGETGIACRYPNPTNQGVWYAIIIYCGETYFFVRQFFLREKNSNARYRPSWLNELFVNNTSKTVSYHENVICFMGYNPVIQIL